jgi:xanthine dehydrogenase accessory factor
MAPGARVVVRGGGELASAAARLLFLSGFPVVVLERAQPLAVRRLVSFADAVFTGERAVEGVVGRLIAPAALADAPVDFIPVIVDPDGAVLDTWRPDVVVDARMTKRAPEPRAAGGAFLVGLGPGFTAGVDAGAVVETQRGPDLGRVLWSGSATPDTTLPAAVLGFTSKRVLRAPVTGTYHERLAIGAVVIPGDVVADVDGQPVTTPIAGLLRGAIRDGVTVQAGAKVGDVDPRGPSVDPSLVSDKARAVAAGVLEAVLMRLRRLT